MNAKWGKDVCSLVNESNEKSRQAERSPRWLRGLVIVINSISSLSLYNTLKFGSFLELRKKSEFNQFVSKRIIFSEICSICKINPFCAFRTHTGTKGAHARGGNQILILSLRDTRSS